MFFDMVVPSALTAPVKSLVADVSVIVLPIAARVVVVATSIFVPAAPAAVWVILPAPSAVTARLALASISPSKIPFKSVNAMVLPAALTVPPKLLGTEVKVIALPGAVRLGVRATSTLSPAAPAAVWAGQLRSGQNSFGFIAGENLALKP